MQQYERWIDDNVDKETRGYGKCEEITELMCKAFPELQRRKGFIDTPLWGRREHWWTLTPDRRIVDPTARQFPLCVVFPSKEHAELIYTDLTDLTLGELADVVPTGRCWNCDDDVYHENTFCSDSCYRSAVRSLG